MTNDTRTLSQIVMNSFFRDRSQTARYVMATLACAALYFAVAARGILTAGRHPDDWRQLGEGSSIWLSDEGRWAMDLLFRALFSEQPFLSLQTIAAFGCFLWISYLLARHAAPAPWRAAAMAAIFALGVNHPYLCDALHFDSHVFAYPLALALSATAFDLVARKAARGFAHSAAAVLIGAQLLALSLGLYQSYAIFGLMVPALIAMRGTSASIASLVRLGALSLAVIILGVAIGSIERTLYVDLTGAAKGAARFAPADISIFLQKLVDAPEFYKRLFTGGLLHMPSLTRIAPAALIAATAAAAGALIVIRALDPQRAMQRFMNALPAMAGSFAALFVIPGAFWFVIAAWDAPARAVGFIGFAAGGALIAALSGVITHLAIKRRHVMGGATAVMISAMALGFAGVASNIWRDRAAISNADVALARRIDEKLSALDGFHGDEVRIIGAVEFPRLSWGRSLDVSVFHLGNPDYAIFRKLLGRTYDVKSMMLSPQPCAAFPEDGSVFLFEGKAHVCLNAFGAFPDTGHCVVEPSTGVICAGHDAVIVARKDCGEWLAPGSILDLVFDRPGRTPVTRSISYEQRGIALFGRCLYFAEGAPSLFDSLSVNQLDQDAAPQTLLRVAPNEMRPIRLSSGD